MSRKLKVKEKLKAQRHEKSEEKRARSKARREVKEFLGFDSIIKKLKMKNPCLNIPL